MSDQDSSDDSVVFQPRIKTKEEAIRRIRKYSPDRPDRRHSSLYQYLDKTSTSTASEYVTCDNTMASKFSSEADSLEVQEYASSLKSTSDIIEISSEISDCNSDNDDKQGAQEEVIESIQLDSSSVLDNTFEEYERLIRDGLDYVMPDIKKPDEIIKSHEDLSSKCQLLSIDDGCEGSCDSIPQRKLSSLISGSFMSTPNEDNYPALQSKNYSKSAQKSDNRPKIEPKKPNSVGKALFKVGESRIRPPMVNSKELFGKSKEKLAAMPDAAFKVPAKPAKSPLRPNLKNIVSPVGIYIKHSPKYCPMIKVPLNNKLFKTPSPSSRFPKSPSPSSLFAKSPSPSSISKENTPPPTVMNLEIPPVIYKPAKTRVETVVREVNLPESIKKLVKPQTVTRHEGRVNNRIDESIERRLMESDLSIDTSNSSDIGDVSVLTHKQPFRSGRY